MASTIAIHLEPANDIAHRAREGSEQLRTTEHGRHRTECRADILFWHAGHRLARVARSTSGYEPWHPGRRDRQRDTDLLTIAELESPSILPTHPVQDRQLVLPGRQRRHREPAVFIAGNLFFGLQAVATQDGDGLCDRLSRRALGHEAPQSGFAFRKRSNVDADRGAVFRHAARARQGHAGEGGTKEQQP